MTFADSVRAASKEMTARNYQGAEFLFREALKQEPGNVQVLFNLAHALHQQGRWQECAEIYGDILLLPGEYPREKAAAANNLGLMVLNFGRYEEAIVSFRLALELDPDLTAAHNNIGTAHLHLGQYGNAQASYDKALSLDADCWDARMSCGTIKLLMGDMPRGWREYEHRWKASNLQTIPIRHKKPRWKGQDLKGKTILLTSEQGLGDAIMGIRYAWLVKDREPARIVHHGHAETVDLFAGVECLDQRTAEHDPNDIDPTSYDYHCPLFSLPDVFGTRLGNIPASVPYIHVEGAIDLPDNGRPKIALAWAGSPGHKRDRERSIDLATLAPLLSINADFYGIQKGQRAEQIKGFPQITDLTPRLKTLTDTAQALNAMDLLISVDTMLIHLAGALARPVWSMIPRYPDWRWMLSGDTSPWYPTMRLFRQETTWDDVVDRIKREYEHRGLHPQPAC